MRPRWLPRPVLVAVALVAGLLLGVGIDIVRKGGLAAWLAPGLTTPADGAPAYVALGRTITVDGRAVYLDCRGSGSPTIVLEAGFGSGANSWGSLHDGLAAISRTCAWDRPGIGQSAPRGLHSAGQTADDLRAALGAAGEHGPFVAVAHSLGGVYARLFAATEVAGEPVAGLVMLDTYEPDLGMASDPALDEAFRREVQQSLDEAGPMFLSGEDLDWPATLEELAERSAPGSRPPTLLLYVDPYARYHDADPARLDAKVAAWWRAIRARYPEGDVEIVPNAGHFIHLDQPALVIERVRAMITRLRG